MDYRKLYEDYYGKIGENRVIHHIDHDKNNNKLFNLVSIPATTHSKYHNYFYQLLQFDPGEMVRNEKAFLLLLNKFKNQYLEIINYANLKNL